MARGNFDFKKFMLEKGERVGLWTAVGFMVLLIVFSLFMPGSGFLSGSQSANADTLKKKNEAARARIRSASPPADLGKIPAELSTDQASQTLVAVAPFRGSGDSFYPHPPDNSKRRMPRIFPTTQALAKDLLVQFRSYIFQPNTGKIGVVRGLEAGASQLAQGPRGGGGPRGGMMSGSGLRPGGQLPPGAMGAPMGGPRGSGGGGMPGMMGPTGLADPGVKEGKFEWAEINKVDNLNELAEKIRPMAVAEVVASFPFKKEVEEFRDALRKQTIGDLFADPKGVPTIKDIVVERSELQLDGTNSAWAKVDFGKEFKNIYIEGGKRREQEDPALQPILEYSLLMPRPLQYRDGHYANQEKELTDVKNTLAAIKEGDLKKRPKSQAALQFERGAPFDPFGREENPADAVGGYGAPGTGGVRPGGAGALNTGSPPGTGQDDYFIPDASVVRFLDVTVEPGKTYDYRIQIVMLNPNYKEVDKVAFPEIAREETLRSGWSPPVRVTIQPDLNYYVTDEKENERGTQSRRQYNGAADVTGDKERVAMQVHKWFEGAVPPGNTEWFPSGEWLLADRILVHRGEYIGRTEKAEMPIWLYTRQGFVIANNPKTRGAKKEIEANFGFEKKPPDEAILVDFEGGKVSYDRAAEKATGDDKDKRQTSPRTSDTVPIEVLILMPDGRLLARDSKTDTADDGRKERRTAWQDRIAEVKGKSAPKKPAGAGNDLFDGRSGGGGGKQ
jgi:hypothetical protein